MTMNSEKLAQALPVDQYGQGAAKTFQQLLKEIEAGETQILWQEERPIRLVSVVMVEVRHAAQTLVETRQEFADGRVRFRNQPGLSEKRIGEEAPEVTAARALHEELGLPLHEVAKLTLEFCGRQSSERESLSYPGLVSRYDTYVYEVCLPDHLYQPEYVEVAPQGQRTYFGWEQAGA